MAFLLLLSLFSALALPSLGSSSEYGPAMESTIYTPAFELPRGGVMKEWYEVEFPEGHLGIRSVNAELVDEFYNPVPLSEAYLHHWTFRPFDAGESEEYWDNPTKGGGESDGVSFMRPRGLPEFEEMPSAHENGLLGKFTPEEVEQKCKHGLLTDIGAWFGVGSETRHTNTSFPAPYAVETGNPSAPRKTWKAQIHAIDVRDTLDPWGCLECLCSLYDTNGLTEFGKPIPADYTGGYSCCYTGKTCKLKEEALALPETMKKRYLKITLQYVKWDPCIVPVRVYFLDVANCVGEYTVEPCELHSSVGSCVHKKVIDLTFPKEGHMVFAEGHLHYGGMGIKMARIDGSVVCDSLPIHGRGAHDQVGDEAGYVTGMGTCEFANEEMAIGEMETVVVESVYDRFGGHTGVMGQFVVGVAVKSDYVAPTDGTCLGVGRGTNKMEAESEKRQAPGVSISYPTLALILAAGPALAIAAAAAAVYVMKRRAADQGTYSTLPAST